jgi:hypothetical protein
MMGAPEPDDDPFNRAAGRHYRMLRTQTLRQILIKARNGMLKPDWRDTVNSPQRSVTTHHIYTDGDMLAIEELRQMDYTAWEPGHVSSWRDALSAWYVASRQALHEDRALALQLQVTSTQDRDKTLSSALRLRSQGVNAVDQVLRLETAIDSTDVTSDSAQRTSHDLYVVARDDLGASYRAGLRAGGDDVDWIAWYRDHINRWPAGTMKDIVAARLDRPDYAGALIAWR